MTGDLEYWDEEDSNLDADFPTTSEPLTPPQCCEEILNPDEQAIVWWVVAFTCVFQTCILSRLEKSVAYLQFLGALLVATQK